MHSAPQHRETRVEPDGVRVIVFRRARTRKRWTWLLACGVAILGAFLWYEQFPPAAVHFPFGLQATPGTTSVGKERGSPRGQEPQRAQVAKPVQVRVRPRPEGVRAPHRKDASSRVLPPAQKPVSGQGEEPAAEELSGIALFPPPGTNPPKSGLIVPEDYELPPGYVRHYQVTDDGKPLPPILMFHPDVELLDAQGRPIPLPPDLVVPPELAPPGFPMRKLEVPETNIPFIEVAPPEPDSP